MACKPCPVCQTQAGAWTDWLTPTAEIANIAAKARSAVQSKYNFSEFTVVRYRSQLVAGANYAIQVQAGDFLFTLDVFQSLDGSVQLNTPRGPVPLGGSGDRGGLACPAACKAYGQTRQGRRTRVQQCGKYISGFGWCGDESDWGTGFLEKPGWGPMTDCRSCK